VKTLKTITWGCMTFVIAIAACAYQITDYPPQPKTLFGPQVPKAIVTIVWTDDVDDISKHCGSPPNRIVTGCSETVQYLANENRCTVWASMPRNFDDEPRLAILGHELLHCLGAQHARN
jgi:hypothetical protein